MARPPRLEHPQWTGGSAGAPGLGLAWPGCTFSVWPASLGLLSQQLVRVPGGWSQARLQGLDSLLPHSVGQIQGEGERERGSTSHGSTWEATLQRVQVWGGGQDSGHFLDPVRG